MLFVVVTVIIPLVLILIIIGAIFYAVRKVRRRVQDFSQMAFGTPDIAQGLRSTEQEYLATPRSVTSATSMYKPMIMRDFPEFQIDEMRARAENVLVSFLRSVDEAKVELLTEGNTELKNQLHLRIDMQRMENKREHFEDLKIHRTEIARYKKQKGLCVVVFQSAIQYVTYIEEFGKPVYESQKKLKQAKYNIELAYVQDHEQVENLHDAALGLTCPNCGAPIKGLGAKVCAYCDSPIVELNIKAWNFNKVTEVR